MPGGSSKILLVVRNGAHCVLSTKPLEFSVWVQQKSTQATNHQLLLLTQQLGHIYRSEQNLHAIASDRLAARAGEVAESDDLRRAPCTARHRRVWRQLAFSVQEGLMSTKVELGHCAAATMH